MRFIFLALSLLSTVSIVRAAPCSKTRSGPCTPDAGGETDTAEMYIGVNIEAAQLAEPDVEGKKVAYLAVRDNKNVTAADRKGIFDEYRKAKTSYFSAAAFTILSLAREH